MIKNKLKVRAYKNAGTTSSSFSSIMSNVQMGLEGAGSLMQSFTQAQQPTTSTSQANMSTAANIFNGAATGAKIGSKLGPIGTAAGAVIGAVPGIIGHSAKVTNPLGFTEEAYISDYGSGLFAHRGRARRKRDKINAAVRQNVVAKQNTTRLQDEYSQDDTSDAYSFAEGGKSPFNLAYVDDGELISTPDGNITKVPEEGKPTDSNLVNLPGGTRILSDTLKVPGTNKTFAQLGEEFMTKRQSNGTDKYAENSRMLNDKNNKMIYDKLFEIQEYIKDKKGIKPKTKNMNIPAAKDGTEIDKNDTETKDGDYVPEENDYFIPKVYIDTDKYPNAPNSLKYEAPFGFTPQFIQNARDKYTQESTDKIPVSNEQLAERVYKQAQDMVARRKIEEEKQAKKDSRYAIMNGILDNLGKLGELAPALSNMFTGEAETVAPKYNPYERAIMNRMSRRRYNIEPTKRALAENRAIMDYNAARQNTSTGQNLAYRLQSANQLNKSIADLYAQASLMQNTYDKDYADMANIIGQQRVTADNLASEINAQNRAAMRNLRRQGYTDFSNWLQRNRQERNMQARDRAMLDIYKPFLESGTETKYLDQLYSLFK